MAPQQQGGTSNEFLYYLPTLIIIILVAIGIYFYKRWKKKMNEHSSASERNVENDKDMNSSNQQGLSYISLIGAVIASLCFFAPWIGCERMVRSGAELGDDFWLVFASSVLSIIAFFYFKSKKTLAKAKPFISILSFFGLGFLIFKYIKIQSNEFSDAYELKWGSIATFIGFIISLVGISFLKDEKQHKSTTSSFVNNNSNSISQEPENNFNKEVELLIELKDKGILSDDEFEIKKNIIKKEKENASFNLEVEKKSKALIDKLYELKKTNILSEEEFINKKNEIIEKMKKEVNDELEKSKNEDNEVDTKLSTISPSLVANLSQAKLFKLKKYLSIITPNEVIVLHDNNVLLMDIDRWTGILSSQDSGKYQLLFKH